MRHAFLALVALGLAGCASRGPARPGTSALVVTGGEPVYADLCPQAEELWLGRVPVSRAAGPLEAVYLSTIRSGAGPETRLYLLSRRHHLTALTDTGRPCWVFTRLPARPEFPPAEGPGHVALITGFRLWVLDRETGSLVAREDLPFTPATRPALTRFTAYVPALGERRLYAVNLADGAPGWRYRLRGAVHAAPVLAGSPERPLVVVATDTGHVYGFEARPAEAPGAEPAWTRRLAGAVVADLTVSADGRWVYVAAEDYMLYALDAVTGEVRWRFAAGEPLRRPAVEMGDLVFLPRSEDLVALDASTGRMRWCFPGGRRPVCRWGEAVILEGPGRTLRRVLAADGREVAAAVFTEDWVLTDPRGERLFLADRAWRLGALRRRPY